MAVVTSGVGVRTTTTDEMQQGISAAVGINSANGWYPAGLDLCLCLLCGHVEPSEELWQDVSPLIADMASQDDYKPLQGHTTASQGWMTEGYRGRFAAIHIRKSPSEIWAENCAAG